MAIYKNREVTIVSPTRRLNPPSTIQIQYADSTYETVTTSQVKFTEDEKKALLKNFPSEFDNVTVVSDDDVKAVRVGVAPASDTDRKVQAQSEVKTDEARKIDEANKQKAKDEVKKDDKKPEPVKTTVAPVASNTNTNKVK